MGFKFVKIPRQISYLDVFLLSAEHKNVDIRFEYFKLSEPEKPKWCMGVLDNQFVLKALPAGGGYKWCKKKEKELIINYAERK